MGLFLIPICAAALAADVAVLSAQAVGAEPGGGPALDWLSRAGSAAILAAGVVAFLRGWIVPGKTYSDVLEQLRITRAERDRALDLVYKQAELASRALEAAERTRS